MRQLSQVALVFIVLLALNRKIRYGIWRWWHKVTLLYFYTSGREFPSVDVLADMARM